MPAGTVVASGSLVSPGGQQGIPGPNAVSTDAGNQATFGSDSRIYVPDPTPVITSVRLRSFNAVGNPTFEVDQRNAGAGVVNPSWLQDRWLFNKSGTMAVNSQQIVPSVLPFVPGTSFLISRNAINLNLTTQQTTLGAGDYMFVNQVIEGPPFRELSQDVHSLSLLVYSSVVNLKFAVALRDPASAHSLVKLCTVPTANTWILISLPNIPVWTASGNFSSAPGVGGYILSICLASGSTYLAPATDTWQNGNFIGAPGMDNWASKPVNSQFIVAFIQHEPGALCTTLIDKPFTQNLAESLRYYCKNFPYATKPAAGTGLWRSLGQFGGATTWRSSVQFPQEMAKTPTVTLWGVSGAPNCVYVDNGASDQGLSTVVASTSGIQGGAFGASVTGTAYCATLGNYTADTGW